MAFGEIYSSTWWGTCCTTTNGWCNIYKSIACTYTNDEIILENLDNMIAQNGDSLITEN